MFAKEMLQMQNDDLPEINDKAITCVENLQCGSGACCQHKKKLCYCAKFCKVPCYYVRRKHCHGMHCAHDGNHGLGYWDHHDMHDLAYLEDLYFHILKHHDEHAYHAGSGGDDHFKSEMYDGHHVENPEKDEEAERKKSEADKKHQEVFDEHTHHDLGLKSGKVRFLAPNSNSLKKNISFANANRTKITNRAVMHKSLAGKKSQFTKHIVLDEDEGNAHHWMFGHFEMHNHKDDEEEKDGGGGGGGDKPEDKKDEENPADNPHDKEKDKARWTTHEWIKNIFDHHNHKNENDTEMDWVDHFFYHFHQEDEDPKHPHFGIHKMMGKEHGGTERKKIYFLAPYEYVAKEMKKLKKKSQARFRGIFSNYKVGNSTDLTSLIEKMKDPNDPHGDFQFNLLGHHDESKGKEHHHFNTQDDFKNHHDTHHQHGITKEQDHGHKHESGKENRAHSDKKKSGGKKKKRLSKLVILQHSVETSDDND